jgi:hypothetical protein
MIDKEKLEAYLTMVTRNHSKQEVHEILTRFMCRCLTLVEDMLPHIGRKAFQVAKSFWLDGLGHPNDLLSARVECWHYLDANNASINIRNQEDRIIRALLCVLYAEPESEDFSIETLHWFANLFDHLGNFSEETSKLMKV